MPALLSEFASPTEVEIQNAWKDAVFVLDTNVLLHIYRYPEQLRESLFKAIDSVKGSLWIPHHVALEFERRRTDIIFSEKDNTEQAGKNLTKLKNDIQKIIDQADFDKWTITFDYAGSLKKITTELDELSTAVSKISERRLQLSSGDEHRDRLASIVSGGIGAAYESQAFLEAIYREGEERYARKVPPGYGDEKTKDKTPDYQHGGLVYKPKFGDLIIWKQMLDHAKKEKLAKLIFVTDDVKEDWWFISNGRTIGPRPELRLELSEFAGVKFFHILQSARFLEISARQSAFDLPKEAIKEAKSVAEKLVEQEKAISSFESVFAQTSEALEARVQSIVDASLQRYALAWYEHAFGLKLAAYIDFPDFVSIGETQTQGLQILVLKDAGSSSIDALLIAIQKSRTAVAQAVVGSCDVLVVNQSQSTISQFLTLYNVTIKRAVGDERSSGRLLFAFSARDSLRNKTALFDVVATYSF